MAADYIGLPNPEDRIGLIGHAHQISLAVDRDGERRVVAVRFVMRAIDRLSDRVLLDRRVEILLPAEVREAVVGVLDLVAIRNEDFSARPQTGCSLLGVTERCAAFLP